jgi:hypothetical protein
MEMIIRLKLVFLEHERMIEKNWNISLHQKIVVEISYLVYYRDKFL